MTSRLDEQLSRYGRYLDSLLMEVEPEEVIDRTPSQLRQQFPDETAAPRWRLGWAMALGAAALVLVVVGVLILLAHPFSGEEAPPVVTEPEVRRSEALVPTGVRLLTDSYEYGYVVRDSSGVIWAGAGDQVARVDPVTGEARVWTQSDDDAFGQGVAGLAPARDAGVWMLLGDGSLRLFDGELFREVVEAPPLISAQDEAAAVVETPDGSLLASTTESGVFRWGGSSWSQVDDARPVAGAGALAIDAEGTMWVGNVELVFGEYQEEWGTVKEWRQQGRGVSRYDGAGWETFTGVDAAALAGMVMTIEPLPDGTVWVGTDAGLAQFDGSAWSDVDLAEIGLLGETYVTVEPDGTVWVATDAGADGGEGVASFDGSTWSVYGPRDGLPDAGAGSPPLVTEKGVFVGTHDGLFRLDGDLWTQVPLAPTAPPAAPGTPTVLLGVEGLEASADSLWAWGSDEIWRYIDGAWSAYASQPATSEGEPDLVFVGDTPWLLNDSRIFTLDGDGLVEVAATPPGVWRVDGDPGSETLWLSTGEDLYRWDGREMTNVGHPPDASDEGVGDGDGYVGEIIATGNGTVWAAGWFAWVPWSGGLARYDDGTGSWEMVRPLGGNQDVPAAAFAATPDGGLWVMLADWFEDWGWREERGEPTAVLTLVHHDGTTGRWTVAEGLPDGFFPGAMAADNEAVWLAGSGAVAGFEPIAGIMRFDGETWTRYLEGTLAEGVTGIAVAPDGAVWYVLDGALRQLEP